MDIDKPSIEIEKLKKYVSENSGFDIIEKGNILELHFIPFMPEAVEHFPDGKQVEHIMYGEEIEGYVYFYKFVIVSEDDKTEISIDGRYDPVMEWLNYI
ncbi:MULTISPECIES: hypothetical protein [Acidiplasma]|jgi:hypothetical protein|uniref:Uncharacterized protein n=4 Tax=Acidiplasma TaxID=507753 RepID=A0A0Q0XLK5_9ARCH|nr:MULTISPECIES: hypothetical protein [Acidiplasma]KJE48594.1 hypothetical protein TZ01_08005 [Acidiplasma sp. MBA-1]KPV46340.1 hypothetical protein SE19_05950 [Acidiplasma aeolicum]KQB33901.1 hypothetical protein AOG54_06175 [Acidiplasma aeolicum]KQB36259.1 hypothetical protein AOG55_00380 [Acidiplasma cupricumulans]WMT55333.1 MAG: hypothetical protein RE470_01505 [Acidiplasma sp.]